MDLSSFVLDKSSTIIVDMNTAEKKKPQAQHPIQVVSRRTGLSNDVIRVWERRYSVVSPERTENGRRLYSDQDIRRLTLLQKVTGAGRRISDVSMLTDAELENMLSEDIGQGRGRESGVISDAELARLIEGAMDEVVRMDPEGLERSLVDALSRMPLLVFLENFLSTLLARIGDSWHQGQLRIGNEHLATEVIKRFLTGMLGKRNLSGPQLLVATPVEQKHEMGALMISIVAEAEGWQVIYLGPDLPATEIAAVANEKAVQAVCVSLLVKGNPQVMTAELKNLRIAVDDAIRIIAGGGAAYHYLETLSDINACHVPDIASFIECLAST